MSRRDFIDSVTAPERDQRDISFERAVNQERDYTLIELAVRRNESRVGQRVIQRTGMA